MATFPPTTDEIRAESNVVFAEFGYPVVADPTPDRLDTVVELAVAQFQGLTGIDPDTVDVTTPDKRLPIMRLCVRLLAEYAAAGTQMNVVETAADYDMLSSFSAGGYSETRRQLGRNTRILHPWPMLNDALMMVMYFDSNGHAVGDGPAIDRPGVTPVPGAWVNQRGPVIGMFGALPTNPYVVYPEEQ